MNLDLKLTHQLEVSINAMTFRLIVWGDDNLSTEYIYVLEIDNYNFNELRIFKIN